MSKYHEDIRYDMRKSLLSLVQRIPCIDDNESDMFVSKFTENEVEPQIIEMDNFLDFAEEEFGRDFREKIPTEELDEFMEVRNDLMAVQVYLAFLQETVVHFLSHKIDELDVDEKYLRVLSMYKAKKIDNDIENQVMDFVKEVSSYVDGHDEEEDTPSFDIYR